MATTISIMIFRANCTGVCLGCTLGNVVAKLLTAIVPLNMEVIIYSVASQTHIYTLFPLHSINFLILLLTRTLA